MSELLWTYEGSGQYWTETRRFRLEVMPAAVAGVFLFRVLQETDQVAKYMSLASGHRPSLQDAFDAAEAAADILKTLH